MRSLARGITVLVITLFALSASGQVVVPPVPVRAPLTVTPSVTVTEEFNDNIDLDNANKEWDFITGFTPGITLNLETPTYRLTAGYNFTAEVWARNPERNAAFDRQNFNLDGFYQVSPEVILTLINQFSLNTDTNLIAAERVSTGSGGGWSNTLSPGITWRIDPLTLSRTTASYTMQRFDDEEQAESDVFRFDTMLERVLTPRFSGTVGYQFTHLDIEDEDQTTAHTPRIGGIFRATPTVTLTLDGGPMFVEQGDDTYITPAVTATYRQALEFGSVTAFYDRNIGTAGGLGGATINQTFGASVDGITLRRGLALAFAPQYTIVKTHSDDRIDVEALILPLSGTYRFNDWIAVVASYQFYRQRSDSTFRTASGAELARDADQNRVFVGVQFGYPFRFDSPFIAGR
jgi:hypothetical protein